MKNKKKLNPGVKSLIGIAIAVLFCVFLFNPQWLPISKEAQMSIKNIQKEHFLLNGDGQFTIANILNALLAIAVLWIIYEVVRWLLFALAKKDERAQTIASLLGGAAKYLAVIIGIVWVLSILGVDSVAVLAGVGIIGLIIGFGAQTLIEDIITGIFIIFEGKYAIGDIIILDDFRGVVRDIGVRTTTIEDAGRNLKVVNNSDIRNFQNRSKNVSLAICEVSVAYDTDLPKMEAMLSACLPKLYENRQGLWLSEPRYLGVTELGDSGVLLKFVVDTKEKDIFDAQRALNRDIRVLFAQQGVEIPFPQVVVHQGG